MREKTKPRGGREPRAESERAMKINPIQNKNIVPGYKVGRGKYPDSTASVQQGRDEITISTEAMSFAKTLSDIKSQVQVETRTPAELARINDITNQIRSGEYNVSAAAVAAKIIGSVIPE